VPEDCTEASLKPFRYFIEELGAGERVLQALCPRLKCRRSGDEVEVFCLSEEVFEFIQAALASERSSIALSGLLAGDSRGGVFQPSIALALAMADYVEELESVAIVRDGKEKKFAYGKPLSKGDYILKVPGKSIYLVATNRLEPIGWGRVVREKLVPLIDIGWFIRSGY